jgi:hypothetical protein
VVKAKVRPRHLEGRDAALCARIVAGVAKRAARDVVVRSCHGSEVVVVGLMAAVTHFARRQQVVARLSARLGVAVTLHTCLAEVLDVLFVAHADRDSLRRKNDRARAVVGIGGAGRQPWPGNRLVARQGSHVDHARFAGWCRDTGARRSQGGEQARHDHHALLHFVTAKFTMASRR